MKKVRKGNIHRKKPHTNCPAHICITMVDGIDLAWARVGSVQSVAQKLFYFFFAKLWKLFSK